MLRQPWHRLVGSGDVDVWNHAWGPWWWWDSLSQGQLPWRTQLLKWPVGGELWFIDPLLALVGAPLVPLLGPVGAYNGAILLSLSFTSWAAARLAGAFGLRGGGRFVASAVLVAGAYLVSELHNGISEAVHLGPVALALAWTEDAARSGHRRAWAKAGLGVGLAAAASPYLGLAAGIAALVRGLPELKRAWLGGVVGLVVAAPPALLLGLQLRSPDAIVKHPESMNLELAGHNAVDPRSFLAPMGFQSVDLSAEGFLHSGYIGLLALLLAGLGAWVLRRPGLPAWKQPALLWPLAAALCALFALGPFLFYDGALVLISGSRLRLPWWGIQALAPGLAVTHPLRLAAPVFVLVAGFAAVGASHLPHGLWRLLLPLLLFDGLVVSGAPWPLQTAEGRPPAALAALRRPADEPVRHAILDLPTDVGATMATSRYLFWQTAHRRPIPYGPDARASTSALLNESAFRPLAALSRRRGDESARLGLDNEGVPHVFGLSDYGIRYLAVHRDLDPEAAARIEAALTAELGPGTLLGATVLWDLGAEQAGDAARRELTAPREPRP